LHWGKNCFLFNHMVNNSATLNVIFAALADPTRRNILERLTDGATNVTALAKPFRISLPAISKHLRVLEKAGLVTRTRKGRVHQMRADPEPLRKASSWMTHYVHHWEGQFAAMDRILAEQDKQNQEKIS